MNTDDNIEVEVFKYGAGRLLTNNMQVSLHYSIALSNEDLHAERFMESSYITNIPIVGILGESGSFNSIVSKSLIGQNAYCTIRIKVNLSGLSNDIPQSVVIELWPDNDINADQKDTRFEKVFNYTPKNYSSDADLYLKKNLVNSKGSSKAWIKEKIDNASVSSHRIVFRLPGQELEKFYKTVGELDSDIRLGEPTQIGDSEEYAFDVDTINLLKELL